MEIQPSERSLVLEAGHVLYLHRILLKLGVRGADVHDLAQGVMLNAHRGASKFRGTASVETWLFRICERAVNRHRSRARAGKLALPVEHAEAASDSTTPLDALLRKERVITLQKRMRALTFDQRQVVIMHELEGQPMREVAARLNRPLQTVYSQLHAARRDLGIELSVARAGVRGESRAGVRRVAPASRLAR